MPRTPFDTRPGLRLSFSRWIRVALIAVGAATAAIAAAATLELPPVVTPPTKEHHPGKVIWVDLVTPDLEAAKRFYGGLFGWTFRDVPTGESGKEYTLALLGDRPVGGLFHKAVQSGDHRRPSWLTFVAVRDVGKAQTGVLAAGGKVLSPPRAYPKRGRQAVFADPQGAVFAVLQSSSGDPEDYLAAPGEWIWSSLITSDPGSGAAFYQKLFGYEVFDLSDDDGDAAASAAKPGDIAKTDTVSDRGDHLLLATDGYARASANPLPSAAPQVHSHWLNFVRVVSVSDAAAKAASLGGRVLVEPRADRQGGMIAIIADPAGAIFGVLEWPDTESKEVTK